MEFLVKEYYGNTLEKWLISLGIILGSVLLAKVCYWIIGKIIKQITSRTKSKLDDILVDKFEEPGVMAIIIVGSWYAVKLLTLKENIKLFFDHAFILAIAIDITWFLSRFTVAIIDEYLAPLAQKSESKLDDALLPILRRGTRIIIWTVGIIMGLNNAGFDVAALIAGLGIGGLALALASQDTVKNIIGGMMIILDKPFKIGERIVIDKDFDGIIEDIGVRSTRMRTLDGRQVIIPNMLFSDKPIVNISREPSRRIIVTLGLIYATTPEQIELAQKLLKEITDAHPLINKEQTIVYFSNFGAYSLDITLIYFIQAINNYFAVQHEINSQILIQFNKHGLQFAFPTQTIYKIEQQASL
jgi:MscS family membrane protein